MKGLCGNLEKNQQVTQKQDKTRPTLRSNIAQRDSFQGVMARYAPDKSPTTKRSFPTTSQQVPSKSRQLFAYTLQIRKHIEDCDRFAPCLFFSHVIVCKNLLGLVGEVLGTWWGNAPTCRGIASTHGLNGRRKVHGSRLRSSSVYSGALQPSLHPMKPSGGF